METTRAGEIMFVKTKGIMPPCDDLTDRCGSVQYVSSLPFMRAFGVPTPSARITARAKLAYMFGLEPPRSWMKKEDIVPDFVYFQMNNGIWSFLDYVGDITADRPLRLSSNL